MQFRIGGEGGTGEGTVQTCRVRFRRGVCVPAGSGQENTGSSSSRVSVAPNPLLILKFAWVSHEVSETGLRSVLEFSLGRVLRFLFTRVGEQMGTGLASICERVSG